MWGEKFGELIKGEKENENMQQTGENLDYKQWGTRSKDERYPSTISDQ